MTEKCKICNKNYKIGCAGTVNGCDKCLGIQRDVNGYAWLPEETYQDYENVKTGKVTRVSRGDAFKSEAF